MRMVKETESGKGERAEGRGERGEGRRMIHLNCPTSQRQQRPPPQRARQWNAPAPLQHSPHQKRARPLHRSGVRQPPRLEPIAECERDEGDGQKQHDRPLRISYCCRGGVPTVAAAAAALPFCHRDGFASCVHYNHHVGHRQHRAAAAATTGVWMDPLGTAGRSGRVAALACLRLCTGFCTAPRHPRGWSR